MRIVECLPSEQCAPYEWGSPLRGAKGCGLFVGIRFQTSRHLTSPLQEASGPHELSRKYGKANRNDDERWPRQDDQSNPDQSYSAANNGDNNAFGEAKLRMLIAFHLIAVRLK